MTTWTIHNQDVVEWAKNYTGPKFHAILCDPPYNLATITKRFKKVSKLDIEVARKTPHRRTSSGFMNKSWDSEVAFDPDTWIALAEHLYPGAFIMAFGGCYTQDTEVLTKRGWVNIVEIDETDIVASLNPTTELVEWLSPIRLICKSYQGLLYHYSTNRVDLVVTPEHRMFVQGVDRRSNFRLVPAREHGAFVRMTKTSFGRSDTITDNLVLSQSEQGVGHGHNEILPEISIPMSAWLPFFGLWMAEGSASLVKIKSGYGYNVSIAHFNVNNLIEIQKLLSPYFNVLVYKQYGKLRINSKQLVNYLGQFGHAREKFIPENIKRLPPEQIRLFLDWYARGDGDREGRIYTSSQKLRDDVQEIAMYAGWAADWRIAKEKIGIIRGREIKSTGPQYIIRLLKKQVKPEVYQRSGNAPVRRIVSSEQYGNMVYCIELDRNHTLYVRRNGKAVWCGNSRTYHRLATAMENAGLIINTALAWHFGSGFPKATRVKDNPEFESHRYSLQALKPASEFIALAQKPYVGKPIHSIVETGAGTLNIDGGRLPTHGENLSGGMINGTSIVSEGWDRPWRHNPEYIEKNKIVHADRIAHAERYGRWPANLCLTHSVNCVRVGARRVRSDGHTSGKIGGLYNLGLKPMPDKGNLYANVDGKETIEAWECVESCPIRLINEQSGSSKSSGGRSGHEGAYQGGYKQAYYGDKKPGLGDEGGASRFYHNSDWSLEIQEQIELADPFLYCAKASRSERDAGLGDMPERDSARVHNSSGRDVGGKLFCQICEHRQGACKCDEPEWGYKKAGTIRNGHPTIKPLKLCKWLATLLLPPDRYSPRRLLVPFAGVMSEAIGAMLAGWEEIVGIELEEQYVPIGEARMKYWQTHTVKSEVKTTTKKAENLKLF